MSVNIRTDICTDPVEDPALIFTPESDDFQNHTYKGIFLEQAVLTNAPTGSGKSLAFLIPMIEYLREKPLLDAYTC